MDEPETGGSDPAVDSGPAVDRDEDVEDEPPRPREPAGVPLASGSALAIEEANALAADVGARLVTPLGPVRVGKTTLMVEIYARFLSHTEWADCTFSWSDTLLEFELLAFPSRLAAGAGLPTTWRTRLGEEALLHLQLRSLPGQVTDLLFLNVSGELSDRVRDGLSPNEEIPLLASSKRLLICVDGERVATGAGRGQAVSHARQLLRTMTATASLGTATTAALVLTKWDKVVNAGCEKAWDHEEKVLVEELAKLGCGSTSFRVAARPETPVADDGMEPLLRWLLTERTSAGVPLTAPPPPGRAMGRAPGESA